MKEVSAGGVVFERARNRLLLMLIEDRYGKWSFPKGKQEAGESLEETALREIQEETGIVGKLIQPLETIHYQYFHPDAGLIEKEVHYFLVEKTEGVVKVQREEIRGVHWFEPLEAWQKQCQAGYENNHSVLLKALRALQVSIPHP